MRVIIAGGREVRGERADDLVRSALAESGWSDQITQIIHGGALGIDTAASRVCRDTWPVLTVYAKWKDYGTAAGPIRNQHMAKMADALIAVWDGESRGTKNMIETAKKRGLKVYIHRY